MLSTVLHTFKEIIKNQVRQSGSNKPVNVEYVDMNYKGDILIHDAINLVLFSSKEMKDIKGSSTFGPPVSESKAIMQKPALKLSLNVLLIFNLKNYKNSVDCYGQVLGHFYNNDILQVMNNGYQHPINVLISGFDDRNEIEIRNSFNIPGTPILRYDLLYALIQGDIRELDVVKKVGLGAHTSGSDEPPVEAMENLIYNLIENALEAIQQQTAAFSSISPDGDSRKYFSTIDSHYTALIAEYTASFKYIKALNKLNQNEELQKPRPYLFALETLKSSIKNHEKSLDDQWSKLALSSQSSMEELDSGHKQFSSVAKTQVKANKESFSLLVEQCRVATIYLPVIKSIIDQVNAFNSVGDSIYEPIINEFKPRKEITLAQQKQKWWLLEEHLIELRNAYKSPLVNALLDNSNTPYLTLKNELEVRKAKLKPHLSKINLLNKEHNKLDKDIQAITPAIEQDYLTWYKECHIAVNRSEKESIAKYLERIFNTFLEDLHIKLNRS